MKLDLFKKRSGESLIEIVVAMVVISISVTIAINLLISSNDSTNLNRNYLLGDNLANEGIEAVYNMVYTNVIRYGTENIDDCWLVYHGDFFADECDENQIVSIPDARLIVESYLTRGYSQPDLHWELDDRTNETLDLAGAPAGAETFRLYRADFDEIDSYYYTNEVDGNRPSFYYRSIKLEIDPVIPDEVTVTARVQWQGASKVDQIEKSITISKANFTES